VSSIRWEALRDGMQDYEYLGMLKRLLEERRDELTTEETAWYEALPTVPASISQSLTAYTTAPGPITARRHEIAKAPERLSH